MLLKVFTGFQVAWRRHPATLWTQLGEDISARVRDRWQRLHNELGTHERLLPIAHQIPQGTAPNHSNDIWTSSQLLLSGQRGRRDVRMPF